MIAFADLFPQRGQPAEAPWRLGLVCLVQYMEDLPDRQAAAVLTEPYDRMDTVANDPTLQLYLLHSREEV